MGDNIEFAATDRQATDPKRRLLLAEARLHAKRDRVADRRRALAAITDPAKRRREEILIGCEEIEVRRTAEALARFRSRHVTTK